MMGLNVSWGGLPVSAFEPRGIQGIRGRELPSAPVPPVRPVSPVGGERSAPVELPVYWLGADPAEMAVRSRIQYPEEEGNTGKSPRETMEEGECQTCKNRKYQDGSDDPGVSFKTPTNISPERAATAVMGHEQEHVVREQARAAREDRVVVSQSVTIHTEICPECGDVYVAGGTTRTTTKAAPRKELFQQPEPEAKPSFEATA